MSTNLMALYFKALLYHEVANYIKSCLEAPATWLARLAWLDIHTLARHSLRKVAWFDLPHLAYTEKELILVVPGSVGLKASLILFFKKH